MQKKTNALRFLAGLILGLLLLAPDKVNAGVTEIQPFLFGEFIVTDNNSVHTITVTPGGLYSHSAGFIEISPTAQPGIYDIDGLMASTAITSITVTALTPMAGPSGNNMTMSAFQTSFTSPTSPAGVSTVRLGGTVSTNGNGTGYLDQTYTGQIQLQINY